MHIKKTIKEDKEKIRKEIKENKENEMVWFLSDDNTKYGFDFFFLCAY